MMPVNSWGIVTARMDYFAVDSSRSGTAAEKIRSDSCLDTCSNRRIRNLESEGPRLEISPGAQKTSRCDSDSAISQPILYRPFDLRWTYYYENARMHLNAATIGRT